jgi:hypothetical protein
VAVSVLPSAATRARHHQRPRARLQLVMMQRGAKAPILLDQRRLGAGADDDLADPLLAELIRRPEVVLRPRQGDDRSALDRDLALHFDRHAVVPIEQIDRREWFDLLERLSGRLHRLAGVQVEIPVLWQRRIDARRSGRAVGLRAWLTLRFLERLSQA